MLFYIFTYVALENFNTNTFEHKKDSPYENFLQFNSFHEGMLIYFQIMLEAGWSSYIYDISYKFDSPYLSNFIFISFDFIIQFIFLSLIKAFLNILFKKGIVWEVFTIVNEEIKNQEQQNQQQNDQSLFTKVKQVNQMFLKKAKDNEDNDPMKDLKNITKNMFQTKNLLSQPNQSEQSYRTNIEKKQQDEEGVNYSQQNLTSDFRGIMLYEKILRNLNSVSFDNSIICNEGQIPTDPKLYERQQTYMKATEESGCEKEVLSEHKEMSQTIVYQTKSAKNNLNLNHIINIFPNNPPVSPEKKDEQLQSLTLNKQISDQTCNRDLSDHKISFANSQQNNDSKQSALNNSIEYDKKRFMFFNTPFFDTDNKLPCFPQEIIQKSGLTKSKSLSNQPTSKQQIMGVKLIQPCQSLIDKFPSQIQDLANSKELSQKNDQMTSNELFPEKQDKSSVQNKRLSKMSIEPIAQFKIINEENDTSYISNKNECLQNKTIGDNTSFLQNQDSSFSELPLKSDNQMKSYLDGPIIMRQYNQNMYILPFKIDRV